MSEGARRNAAHSFPGDATRKRRVGQTIGGRTEVGFFWTITSAGTGAPLERTFAARHAMRWHNRANRLTQRDRRRGRSAHRRLEQLAQERDFAQPFRRCEHGTDRIHIHSRARRQGSLVWLDRRSGAQRSQRRAEGSQRSLELDTLVRPAHRQGHTLIHLTGECSLATWIGGLGLCRAAGGESPRSPPSLGAGAAALSRRSGGGAGRA